MSRKCIIWLGLAVASFSSLALMFTWKFAIFVMVMIGLHECGHLWAAKRCGLKTGGFYFLPFLGGIAFAGHATSSKWDTNFIAIMGPVWGFLVAIIWAGIYWVTSDPIWAYAAFWGAFMNLFNLFPMHPLDGSQISKAILASINPWLGLAVEIIGFVFTGLIFIFTLHPVFAFLAFLGWTTLRHSITTEPFVLKKIVPSRIKRQLIQLDLLEKKMSEPPIGETLFDKYVFMTNQFASNPEKEFSADEQGWVTLYFDITHSEELLEKVSQAPEKSAMTLGQIVVATCWCISLAAALGFLMFYIYGVPGWDGAMKELLGRVS